MCPFFTLEHSLNNSGFWGAGMVNSIPGVVGTSPVTASWPVSPPQSPPPGYIELWWNGRPHAILIFVLVWMQLLIVSGSNRTPIFPKVTSSCCPRSRLSLILQPEKSHRIQLPPVNWAVHSEWLSGVMSLSVTLQFVLHLPWCLPHESKHFFIVLLDWRKWLRVT